MSDTATAAPSPADPSTGNKHDAKSVSATYSSHGGMRLDIVID
jgi:hypothetical protein